jgi:hypothetical protein
VSRVTYAILKGLEELYDHQNKRGDLLFSFKVPALGVCVEERGLSASGRTASDADGVCSSPQPYHLPSAATG